MPAAVLREIPTSLTGARPGFARQVPSARHPGEGFRGSLVGLAPDYIVPATSALRAIGKARLAGGLIGARVKKIEKVSPAEASAVRRSGSPGATIAPASILPNTSSYHASQTSSLIPVSSSNHAAFES